MKFIHLTDTHVVKGTLYGGNPAATLARAVASINAEHGDAAFVVVTGDLTHWGDAAGYEAFVSAIAGLEMPVHLMLGNHDDTAPFAAHFPDVPRDDHGFVQTSFATPVGQMILIDTHQPGTHAGAYCEKRRAWLFDMLEESDDPVFLFMHHPPFPVGIKAMDAIMLQDVDAFYSVLAPFKHRIRHLFFGHLHRALFGNWRGISYSCMRGLNHQVALDLTSGPDVINGVFEPPAYGVVLAGDDTVCVHLHEFDAGRGTFPLSAPAQEDFTT